MILRVLRASKTKHICHTIFSRHPPLKIYNPSHFSHPIYAFVGERKERKKPPNRTMPPFRETPTICPLTQAVTLCSFANPHSASLDCFVRKTVAERKKNPKPLQPSILPMTPKPPTDQLPLSSGLTRPVADLNLSHPFFSLGISLDFG